MGMERIIEFAGDVPAWEAFQPHLDANGLSVVVRMIDGLPAFPNEVPPENWREVRVSLGGGMLTLRSMPGRIAVVTWGNADENLQRDWEKLSEALAAATNGFVVKPQDDSSLRD